MADTPKNKNTIVPGRVVDDILSHNNTMDARIATITSQNGRAENKIDGLIVDSDIIASKLELIVTRGRSAITWNFIRDLILILLLLCLIGLTLWRAMLTDQRLVGCADNGVVSLSIPEKK